MKPAVADVATAPRAATGVVETSASFQSASPAPASPWLLGPWYDALLIANIAWPLLLLLQVGEGFARREGLQFWQIYFLTTPHRWITLALVFFDRERFSRRPRLFVALAIAIVVVCLTVRWTTGTLLCLLAVDYLWNAWHFASQHHGIYRIYSRQALAPGPSAANSSAAAWEKWLLRSFLLYVIVRVAGATWRYVHLEQALAAIDWLAWSVAAWLVARDFWQPRPAQARRLYLLSMLSLYASLLAAVHLNQPALVLSLATASAIFHATEYLAIVTWSVKKREAALGRRLGVLAYLAPRWGVTLAIFLSVLGATAWLFQNHLAQPWLLLNVIIAFLHYTYDGLLWRRTS